MANIIRKTKKQEQNNCRLASQTFFLTTLSSGVRQTLTATVDNCVDCRTIPIKIETEQQPLQTGETLTNKVKKNCQSQSSSISLNNAVDQQFNNCFHPSELTNVLIISSSRKRPYYVSVMSRSLGLQHTYITYASNVQWLIPI